MIKDFDSFLWDVITHPRPSSINDLTNPQLNQGMVNNCIPLYYMDVIIHTCHTFDGGLANLC